MLEAKWLQGSGSIVAFILSINTFANTVLANNEPNISDGNGSIIFRDLGFQNNMSIFN
jgi:hypothetical protein